MTSIITFKDLITWRIRLFLYLSSLSSLLFMQNYCTSICPFIDGLQPMQITLNLGVVFLFHIAIREIFFIRFNKPFRNLSLPRHGYYLSIISWILAGIIALVIHFVRYEDFPFGSHVKLLSSYWILGAGILAQLEYMVFEKRYKLIATSENVIQYHEQISRRILESFIIFTVAPVVTLLSVVGRYTYQGILENKILIEVLFIGLFFLFVVIAVALFFGQLLKKDTQVIIGAINHIKMGEFKNEHHEKFDGSGYPRGIEGEDIHIYGRITAIADVFDALGSDRVYKRAWEDEKIFELLRDQSGKHFDPKLVAIFFENFDEVNAIRQKYRDIEE